MADEWKTDFSIDGDGIAWATATHNGQTQRLKLGPAGGVIAAAMDWVAYNDVRDPLSDDTLRATADYFEHHRNRRDVADLMRLVAQELYGDNVVRLPIRDVEPLTT